MGRLGTELARKGVHVAMGGFAFALRWLSPGQAMLFAAVALAFNLFVLHRLTGRRLLREGERARGWSAGIAIYPAVVLAALVVFADRLELAAAVWALLAFGDGMATVVGVVVGGPRLPWNRDKTWSGFAAFVLYGTAGAALVIPWVQRAALDAAAAGTTVDHVGASFISGATSDLAFLLVGCTVAACAAALAESAETGIDDNIIVPLVGGLTLAAAAAVDPGRLADALAIRGDTLVIGMAVNLVLAIAAYAARSVDRSGAVWGWVLGTALYALADWPGFTLLLAFFVVGTAATKTGYARKAALGIAQERGGRRGARNAFANVTAGVVFAFLAIATQFPEAMSIALAAAFATAAGDTVSSEIGQAYGRTHVLITSLRRVPPGTDGAVSLEGTFAGLAASLAVGALGAAVGLYGALGIALVAIAGLAGNLLESWAGAALGDIRRIDNELVNFANTVGGGLIALALHAIVS